MENTVPRDSLRLASYARKGSIAEIFRTHSDAGKAANVAVRVLINAGASVSEIQATIAPFCTWTVADVEALLSRVVVGL